MAAERGARVVKHRHKRAIGDDMLLMSTDIHSEKVIVSAGEGLHKSNRLWGKFLSRVITPQA